MITHNANGTTWVLVDEIPDGANNFSIYPGDDKHNPQVRFYIPGDSIFHVRSLPPGSYSIHCLAKEATEAEAADVSERYIYSGRISFQAYKDYSGKVPESMDDIISDPIESLSSLLRSHSLTNALILKQVK